MFRRTSWASGVVGLMICLGGPAGAAVIAYTGTGATAGANTGNLNIGRQFSVTGTGITLRELGVWDAGGDGLVNAHTVTFFAINSGAGAANANVTPVSGGSLSVPAGTAAPLNTGFRFATLTTPIFLAPGNYSAVAYGLNAGGGDPFGNGGGFPANGNVTDIRFDPFQFTASTSPTYPTGGDANNHTGASFTYDLGNTVPEPGAIGAAGVVGLLAAGRRRARRAR
ncbi:MAG TPA: hypothetical protein VEA69_01810 [Tepidisphaeraceae bacterium]|nr:hypothetical protein [Tepidisphaeraceae bacterium]